MDLAESNDEENENASAEVDTDASMEVHTNSARGPDELPVVIDEERHASSEAESHQGASNDELRPDVLRLSFDRQEPNASPVNDPAIMVEPVRQDERETSSPDSVNPPDLLELEDDSDEDNNIASYNMAFDDEAPASNRSWYIPTGHVHAAIRELVAQGRRGEGGGNRVGDLLSRDTFMQRMRRLVFSSDNRRRRLRANSAGASQSLDGDGDDFGDPEEQADNDEMEQRENEEEPENPIRFDTNLAAEHSYFGTNMSRVSGVNYLEEGKEYNLMLFSHKHVLFPGEILPFMTNESIIESDIDDQNGLLFGICFTFFNESNESAYFYGVTCQIYEKGTDQRGNALIKSRAMQRFKIKASSVTSLPPFITVAPQMKCYGIVKILPESYLPEPLQCVDMGSLYRFRDEAPMSQMYRRFQAASTPWPAPIYNNYNMSTIVEKARGLLAQYKIETMPTDPVQLSFWLVRNLHLTESMTRTLFIMDSVNMRLKLLASTFKQNAIFTCRCCGNRIADCSELFAMSKHGVQTQYCNSAGYIHEINTVYHLLRDAILLNGSASTEFSWFPGYQWQVIVCKICSYHIGWEFKALEPNLMPRAFFGITRSTVRISSYFSDPRTVIYRTFMRLAERNDE